MIGEYEKLDALDIAAMVRQRKISAVEVIDTAIAAIEARNGPLNAVVTPLYEQARDAAAKGLPDGPLIGVPYLLKELVVSVAGTATTSASRLYAQNLAITDSEIVARYRRAGMAIIGKTNSSEYGLQPVTESHLYGPARNPWNTTFSPGGSSGGAAAAVASGMVPAAHATDGGGSIRIPASCCGLFGLKPTRARMTSGPEGGEGLSGLANQHAVTRTVRDSAALLDATAGPMPGDPYAARPPSGPYLDAVARDPGRLRIAFSTSAPNGAIIHPDCVAAVLKAARLCEELGHHVEEASPQFDVHAAEQGFAHVFQANAMANVGRANGGELPPQHLIEPLTMAVARRGREISAPAYISSLQSLHREARRIARFHEEFDIWLTPTLATPPPPVGHFDSDITDVDLWLKRLMGFIPFTYIANVTGQPAMSIPLAMSGDGLPIGCHFTARYAEEELLFSLAGQIERAAPWSGLTTTTAADGTFTPV